jgi:hypothetical protein
MPSHIMHPPGGGSLKDEIALQHPVTSAGTPNPAETNWVNAVHTARHARLRHLDSDAQHLWSWLDGGHERTCGRRKLCQPTRLAVFVDQAVEPVSAQNALLGRFGRWMRTPGGRVLLPGPVLAMLVVVTGALAGDQS